MKKIGFVSIFAGVLVISLMLSNITLAACLDNCSSQYDTCMNGCRNIQDENKSTSCVDGCMRGYESCKARCGSSSENVPENNLEMAKCVQLPINNLKSDSSDNKVIILALTQEQAAACEQERQALLAKRDQCTTDECRREVQKEIDAHNARCQ
jgi:hypothetical protein